MDCPHCGRSIGSLSKSGEHRVRLVITLVDPKTGRIHGPCPKCREDVTVADANGLVKSLRPAELRIGVRLSG